MSSLEQSLDLLSVTYNYNHWIYSLVRPHVGRRVLEIGSGQGNITRFLLDRDEVTCLEPDPQLSAKLIELTSVHRNIRVVQAPVESIPSREIPPDGYDSVLCVNVLEHIADDVQCVGRMRQVLTSGGKLVLYVPACRFAFGALDVSLGHHRRYAAGELCRMLRGAGFAIAVRRHVNFIGLIGWWYASRVAKEQQIDIRKATMMDRMAPYLSAVEKIAPPPVGQSLLVVACKA